MPPPVVMTCHRHSQRDMRYSRSSLVVSAREIFTNYSCLVENRFGLSVFMSAVELSQCRVTPLSYLCMRIRRSLSKWPLQEGQFLSNPLTAAIVLVLSNSTAACFRFPAKLDAFRTPPPPFVSIPTPAPPPLSPRVYKIVHDARTRLPLK